DAIYPAVAGRTIHITTGEPIDAILGSGPATAKRVSPGGNIALVPAFSDDFLLNTGFEDAVRLIPIGSGKRLKGWQAAPLFEADKDVPLGVQLVNGPSALPRNGKQHASIGFGLTGAGQGKIAQGTRALLTQEVRNPRAGKYTFSVHACGGGSAEI